VLKWLLESQLFESFLAKKFIGEKRFSLEGGESTIVLLNTILEKCPGSEVLEIEMGMAHRGRLNILRNFLQKSLTTLLF
jgi:2-oxoglutarate dehydrogenase E1 component